MRRGAAWQGGRAGGAAPTPTVAPLSCKGRNQEETIDDDNPDRKRGKCLDGRRTPAVARTAGDFWQDYCSPDKVNADGNLKALQVVVQGEAVPFAGMLHTPIHIDLIDPPKVTFDLRAWNSLA